MHDAGEPVLLRVGHVTHQPVPEVTEADVVRVIARDFPIELRQEAFRLVEAYRSESPNGQARVRLAALKLAAGNLEALEESIVTARDDFRNVVVSAEYPEYTRYVLGASVPPTACPESVIQRDWQQYVDWLGRAG